ncbi:GPI transamidase subunit PIG-U protein [Cryptosporidium felis]|nr:GPI transamidase subunit PIG-U protein [Cryptosporidium felis]
MNKILLALICISVLARVAFFSFTSHDLEQFTNGLFNSLGFTLAEVLEFCSLRESGADFFSLRRVGLPVLPLAIFGKFCKSVNSGNLLLPFVASTLAEILQGTLIYGYLMKSYSLISPLSNSVVDKRSYEVCVYILLGTFWMNPFQLYTSSLLSIGLQLELLLQLLLLWISVNSLPKFRALLPVISALIVYCFPNPSVSLVPTSLSLFVLGAAHYFPKLDVYSQENESLNSRVSKLRENVRRNFLNTKSISRSAVFLLSFSATLLSLHAFSFALIRNKDLSVLEYLNKFVLSNFTWLESKDLNPNLNLYWFLMTCIMPEFRFYFQIVLGSSPILFSLLILTSLERVPFKALQCQIILNFVLKPNPTISSHILAIYMILFDSFTLYQSKIGFLAAISFFVWIVCTSSAFLIRSLWILENTLDSNIFYFLTLIGHFSFLFFIGEWIKSLFHFVVKSNYLQQDQAPETLKSQTAPIQPDGSATSAPAPLAD